MRKSASFPIDNLPVWKRRLLHWAARADMAVFMDSNADETAFGSRSTTWDCLLASGAHAVLEIQAGHAFESLKGFLDERGDWFFGFLGYDLKNEVERLRSAHFDGIGMPDMGFFQPETVAGIRNGRLEIHVLSGTPEAVFKEISNTLPAPDSKLNLPALRPRIPKTEYLATVEAIRRHIIEGDVYEMNFCQEFYAEQAFLEPLPAFEHLNALSEAPFSTFMRWHDRYLLCGSPERFLRKEAGSLISQPIKGTRRRGTTPEEDAAIREELAGNIKDRAENVMIVDLVRNDLARNCLPGSVVVDELFAVYTFATVHQMISSVRGTLRPGVHPVDALRDAFPMGSMTGAPKVMAMLLIEQYERTRRGLYSGAVGYFDPRGDFDFNVVIRSILYNAAERYASVQVGGAIVYDSVAELEYEECLVKAEAMRKVLEG